MRSFLAALSACFGPGLAAAADTGSAAGQPDAIDPDTSRVIQLVSSIPMAVDLGRFDLAEAAFAPSVVVDYTSLWGGEPATMSPAELMAGWRGIVPGFDATYHELNDVRAIITGDAAVATAQVDGRHWIGTRLWRPIGAYRWDLARGDTGHWQVTRMVFTMTREDGDRALAAEAMARVQSRTSPTAD